MKLFVCETIDNRTLIVLANDIIDFHHIMSDKKLYVRVVMEITTNIIEFNSSYEFEEVK